MTAARWRHWQDWPLGAKAASAVAIPLILLLLAVGFSYRIQQSVTLADADVRRALAIQADIQTLHSLIAESATGVRGYLLTGREEFLAPYREAQAELPVTLTSLRRNIRDPEMKAHLAQIQDLLQRKLDSLEELKQNGRALGADDLQVHLLSSKAVLDALRAEIRAMTVREANLVADYSDKAARALQRNLWVDGLTSLLVLATGVGAFLLLFSGVVRRVQRLTLNAEHLALGEPLEALPAGRDEVGLLAERLHNASLLLARRADEARAASEAKSQFLSRTSHELRTPLHAILGFAELLHDAQREPQQRAQIAQIMAAGRHLLQLIDEVLDIARIESRELHVSLSPVSLLPLVQDVHALVAPMATASQITITLAPSLEGIHVQADAQRLRQVLLNLVTNAIKYNRLGGRVQVTAHVADNQVEMMVEDNGIGIAAALLHRLFTPFDRLAADTTTVPGTGLGLALSQQLMQCMGGEITVSSMPDVGSRFTLRLAQAAPVSTPASDAPLKIPADPPTGCCRALVISHQTSHLTLLQAVIGRRPHWVMTSASDGQEGLQKAGLLQPDLILLDLHLPEMSSEAVLAALQREAATASIPVVVLGADTLPETAARLKAAGAVDYLTKPIAVPRLLALLDTPL